MTGTGDEQKEIGQSMDGVKGKGRGCRRGRYKVKKYKKRWNLEKYETEKQMKIIKEDLKKLYKCFPDISELEVILL